MKGKGPEHPPAKSCTLDPGQKTMFSVADYETVRNGDNHFLCYEQ